MKQIVRLDSVQAVYGGGHIYSVQSAEAQQNANFGVVGNLLAGEREVREFKKPSDLTKDKAVIVAQDEINYDESRRSSNDLRNFEIEADKPFRTYDLAEGDIVSISKDAIVALGENVVVGNKVVLQVGSHKLGEILPEGEVGGVTTERFVGRIEAIEQIGTTTVVGAPGVIGNVTDLVVIRVEQN